MTDSTLETVLRRDRWIVAGALGMIVALAWGYVLWLANDMDMGGMDMTGFRMIPAGIGIMLPASAPWRAHRVRVRVRHVGGDDGRHDGTLGSAHDPHVRPRGSTGESAGQAVRGDRLVRRRLFPGLDRLFAGSNLSSNGRSSGQPCWIPGWRAPAICSAAIVLIAAGTLSMDAAQGRLSRPMPDAVPVPDAPRRLSRRRSGLPAAGASARGYCVGCCWVLMALLFVGGVMNVLWIALLACSSFWRSSRRLGD